MLLKEAVALAHQLGQSGAALHAGFGNNRNYLMQQVFHQLFHTTAVALRNLSMTRFRDQYIQNWNNQLTRISSRKGSAGNKLRTYRLFKTTFELEPYLYLTKIIKHRVTVTRISCHSLEIERGRYHKPTSIPARPCSCKDCECVEDGLHFVCVCPKYDLLRECRRIFLPPPPSLTRMRTRKNTAGSRDYREGTCTILVDVQPAEITIKSVFGSLLALGSL